MPSPSLALCRNVTDGDVLSQEKKLNQTMEMIISKKKRYYYTYIHTYQ